MIVRMSASAAASMMGLTGYPMRNFTPSRLRISATAAAAFMIHSPRVEVRSSRLPRGGAQVRHILRQGCKAGRTKMTRDELKRRVDEAIERHADAIIEVGETIRRHPELGFKESRTATLVESKFSTL